jgi:hypothetical protein
VALRRNRTVDVLPRRPTLTAAARRVQLGAGKTKRHPAPAEWQAEAWDYVDEIPEVKKANLWSGAQMAKLRLFAGVRLGPDQEPIPIDDEAAAGFVPDAVAQAAAAELDRLRSETGSQSEIVRELQQNLEVAGECYLIGYGERSVEETLGDGSTIPRVQPEYWEVRSISEVDLKETQGGTVATVKEHPGDKGTQLHPDQDTCIRIWTKHPRWSALADSPMRGVLGECRILTTLSAQVYAEGNSRLSAGLLTIPNELDEGDADPDQPDGAEAGSPFEDELFAGLTDPIEDPNSATSVMPTILRGPAEFLTDQYVRHILLGRGDADFLEGRIEHRIKRIARGVNWPVEVILGHQETTYANAEQVDQDVYEEYLDPRARTIVEAITAAFLVPNMLDAGHPPDEVAKVVCWHDPSLLVAQPDSEAAADKGVELGAISAEAWRRKKGFGEDDAPELEEVLLRGLLGRGQIDAQTTAALLRQLLPGIEVPDPPAPVAPAPPAELPPAPAPEPDEEQIAAAVAALRARAIPAASRPANQYGRQLADIDRDLRARLLVAANADLNRGLERAGNRLKAKVASARDVLRDVAPIRAAATLGKPMVAAAGFDDDELLAGTFDQLEQQFMAWGATAQDEAIDVAHRVVSGFSTAERAELKLRQADDLAQAWRWMKEALQSLAVSRLYNPDPDAPDVGEFDPTSRVPTGLVRQAIARAGGATGLQATGKGGAYVTLTDAGTRPAGGIGTGELLRTAMRDAGAGIEAYRWVYGPAHRARPFKPHQRLDGVVFRDFDAAVLTNGSGWPPYSHYIPGDHDGCVCDFEPVVVPVEEVSE